MTAMIEISCEVEEALAWNCGADLVPNLSKVMHSVTCFPIHKSWMGHIFWGAIFGQKERSIFTSMS